MKNQDNTITIKNDMIALLKKDMAILEAKLLTANEVIAKQESNIEVRTEIIYDLKDQLNELEYATK